MRKAANSSPSSPEAREADTFTTGDMARLSNNTLRTVRFYEEAGILQPLRRTDGGHRLFERSQLDRLMLVSDMREAGMSLEEIRVLLETKSRATSGGSAAREAVIALRRHVGDLHAKIDVLTRLAADLERTVETAGVCTECKHEELFPNQCNDCEHLKAVRPLPRAMRVLWSVANNDDVAAAAAEIQSERDSAGLLHSSGLLKSNGPEPGGNSSSNG